MPAPSQRLYSIPSLGYDTSIFELAPQIPAGLQRWTQADLLEAVRERAALEKARRELSVYYYRINHTMAFPLPLDRRPTQLPAGIPKRPSYPWLIWLLWVLEERWHTLHTAWRHLGDEEAGQLLQSELAALSGWSSFTHWNKQVGLPTGHMAACLSRFLADEAGWDETLYVQARQAAEQLIAQDVWPWYEQTWAEERELAPHDIHNIPVIALVRGAQLARLIDFEHVDQLEARALQALRAWWQHRQDAEAPHTEGSSYDGYLMDTFTEWLDGLPNREGLLLEGRAPFTSLVAQWSYSTLPGRPDLHAPLGDVEGEMPFWINCVLRIADWYGDQPEVKQEIGPGLWLLQRVSPNRLPAAAVDLALRHPALGAADPVAPAPGPREVANAAVLRSGWDSDDCLALVGLSRSPMSHLHNDGGEVIVGWQNRFWITDPGYQQYRPGEERDFTMGIQAHNAPVIDGAMQTRRGVRLCRLESTDDGWQHASLDLTACYEGLPDAARVQRDVWLMPGDNISVDNISVDNISVDNISVDKPTVIVRDELRGLPNTSEIHTHWQGGTHLAWAFVEGWARLSDGEQALWIGTVPGVIEEMQLERHAGSRGPLTLVHAATAETAVRWWLFCGDSAENWTPPSVTVESDQLRLQLPDASVVQLDAHP